MLSLYLLGNFQSQGLPLSFFFLNFFFMFPEVFWHYCSEAGDSSQFCRGQILESSKTVWSVSSNTWHPFAMDWLGEIQPHHHMPSGAFESLLLGSDALPTELSGAQALSNQLPESGVKSDKFSHLA